MPEIKDGLTDQEFIELMQSSTDDERLEICRKLANFVKANRDTCLFTDEEIAENDAKFERYAQSVEAKKRAHELLHRVETATQLVEDRLNARCAEMLETDAAHFLDDKDRRSH